jgi:hypothetical protein
MTIFDNYQTAPGLTAALCENDCLGTSSALHGESRISGAAQVTLLGDEISPASVVHGFSSLAAPRAANKFKQLVSNQNYFVGGNRLLSTRPQFAE